MPETFPCYFVAKDATGHIHATVAEKTTDDLPDGDVLIRVEYSSLNYKDALSATGNPGVTRKYPHIPGIDAAGTVAECRSGEFVIGAKVLVTGYDLGQNTWGGFGGMVRVPAEWVVPLPSGLSLRESMILGTAGFTAAQSVDALVSHGVRRDCGDVLVTGASGGVGSLAVAILSKLGYSVTAASGKDAAKPLLETAGAERVIPREDVHDTSGKPLLAARWAGAVDTVGGATLSTVVRSLVRGGCATACGLVGGVELNMSVFPFILRGVALVGIDSAECPMDKRLDLWRRLADDWKPACLNELTTECDLGQVEHFVERILGGKTSGRVLVRPWAS